MDRDVEEGSVKLTQPALMRSHGDEFDPPEGETPDVPATPGTALRKGAVDEAMSEEEQFKCKSATGKLSRTMKWTRPEILSAVRELSRLTSGATKARMKATHHVEMLCRNAQQRTFVAANNEVGPRPEL
jgi:hypothetical protein